MSAIAEPVDERLSGDLWSFFRGLIVQGAKTDWDAALPTFRGYEEYVTRMDRAARERLASPEWQSLASRIAGEAIASKGAGQ